MCNAENSFRKVTLNFIFITGGRFAHLHSQPHHRQSPGPDELQQVCIDDDDDNDVGRRNSGAKVSPGPQEVQRLAQLASAERHLTGQRSLVLARDGLRLRQR